MIHPHLVDEALLQSAMVPALVCHRVALRFTPCCYEMLRWNKFDPVFAMNGNTLKHNAKVSGPRIRGTTNRCITQKIEDGKHSEMGPLDRFVCARHGHELMGCESPVHYPKSILVSL